MKAIIQREYCIFKNNIVMYLCIWTLMPMVVYLLISIPFSFYIKLSNGINYLNWSSVGNWITTSSFLSFILSVNIASRYRISSSYSRTMLCAPSSNRDHLASIIIWSFLMGIIQLFFSLFITLSLKSGNLFFSDILLAVIYIIPIIILMSNIGLLIGLSCERLSVRSAVSVVFLIFMLSSSGMFVPIHQDLPYIFTLSPFYVSIQNIQAIMTNDPSIIFPAFVLLFISIIIFIINLIVSSKVFKS